MKSNESQDLIGMLIYRSLSLSILAVTYIAGSTMVKQEGFAIGNPAHFPKMIVIALLLALVIYLWRKK